MTMTRSMVRLFIGEFPAWARRDHPVLRHELGIAPRTSWRARYGRALVVVLILALLVLVGYMIATDALHHPAGQNNVEAINAVVYWPLLVLQLLTSVIALTSTANVVGDKMRRQNWDSLRATEHGTEISMRARWISVFYRLRGAFGVILAVRALLIGLMLYDLTSFSGRYLDLLINGITPEVPLVAAVLLLSFTMTAALLLPLTTVGFDAAFGLLLSALVQQRTYSSLIQAVLIFVRLVITALLISGATQLLNGQLLQMTDLGGWLLLGGHGALGDWGLAFLNLGRYSEIWATVPYGIFFGLALLIFALVQAALADRLLVFAVRQAQKKG